MIRTQTTNVRSAMALRHTIENVIWYVVLCLIAVVTAFPFVWVFFTSFKGPNDAIYSVPPQLIPHDPTFANYLRVWNQLPVWRFFLNSIAVAVSVVILNVLFCSLTAYPLAKMKFRGRDAIFYLILATFVVPPQLISIPSYVLALNTFHYHNTLFALIFPNLATAFNIFLLRQAFQGVPDDLIDAGRIDGGGELRIWWDILMPTIRPSLATTAIIVFVNMWNDFYWPSLMLPTMGNKTLQVGLVALQGRFANDPRGIAAGVVMTVVPMIVLFVMLQRQFVRGLTGAVKG